MQNENPNPQSTNTQRAMILADLTAGKRLTQLDANVRFGCANLRNRISELRKCGMKINGTWKAVKGMFGKEKRVMEYWMEADA